MTLAVIGQPRQTTSETLFGALGNIANKTFEGAQFGQQRQWQIADEQRRIQQAIEEENRQRAMMQEDLARKQAYEAQMEMWRRQNEQAEANRQQGIAANQQQKEFQQQRGFEQSPIGQWMVGQSPPANWMNSQDPVGQLLSGQDPMQGLLGMINPVVNRIDPNRKPLTPEERKQAIDYMQPKTPEQQAQFRQFFEQNFGNLQSDPRTQNPRFPGAQYMPDYPNQNGNPLGLSPIQYLGNQQPQIPQMGAQPPVINPAFVAPPEAPQYQSMDMLRYQLDPYKQAQAEAMRALATKRESSLPNGRIIEREINGIPHNVLVDPQTGEDIRDLGKKFDKSSDEKEYQKLRNDSLRMRNDFAKETDSLKKQKLGKEIQKIDAQIGKLGQQKPVFTEAHIQQVLGELESGGSASILGTPIEFTDRKDAIVHAQRKLGPNFAKTYPEAMEIIDKNWPTETKVAVPQLLPYWNKLTPIQRTQIDAALKNGVSIKDILESDEIKALR